MFKVGDKVRLIGRILLEAPNEVGIVTGIRDYGGALYYSVDVGSATVQGRSFIEGTSYDFELIECEDHAKEKVMKRLREWFRAPGSTVGISLSLEEAGALLGEAVEPEDVLTGTVLISTGDQVGFMPIKRSDAKRIVEYLRQCGYKIVKDKS